MPNCPVLLHSDLATVPEQPVLPGYGGRSLLNLVSSLAGHFGVETGHAPLTAPLPLDGVGTVVLFVVDGLGHFLLARHLREGAMPHLAALLQAGGAAYSTLTSTFPSSTMIAMTTLHMGASPAQHGWLGTSVHDRGTVVDLLRQRDLLTGRLLDHPGDLLAASPVSRRLADTGVDVRSVGPAAFEGSFLSGWYFDGALSVPYEALPDLPGAVAHAARGDGPRYVVVYWPGFDDVCHATGPGSPEASVAARRVDLAFHQTLAGLPQDGSTLVILTADHGQSDTPARLVTPLHQDTGLPDLLGGPPAGERLVRYLNVRPGGEAEVAERLAGAATLLPASEAWQEGLFGGPPAREEFLGRTGNWIAVARHGHQMTWAYPAKSARPAAGDHGSLSAEQMVVPLVALRR